MTEKISVLCSVYNAELYLADSIESILKQSYSDFEFLIIDDASSDQSKEIILSYKDPRIKLIENKKNIGLTASLNKGIKLTKAKYIFRQDADDISKPNRIEKQLAYMENNPSIICLGSSVEVINNKNEYLETWSAPLDMNKIKQSFCFDNALAHSSICFDRNKVLELGLYDEKYKYCQDFDLWLRMCHAGNTLANIEEVLVQRRRGSSSFKDIQTSEMKIDYNKELISRHLKYLLSSNYNDEELNQFAECCTKIRYEKYISKIPDNYWEIVHSIDSYENDLLNKSTVNIVYNHLSDLAYQLSALNTMCAIKFYSDLKKIYPLEGSKYSVFKIIMRMIGMRKLLRLIAH